MYIGEAFPTTMHMIQKCMQPKIQRCLYIMLHMPCKMQEMNKGKLSYVTKELPHTTQEIKHTPSSPPRKWVKVAWSRGLVKELASWSCMGTWIKVIFRFSTLSLRKWYITSMCLVWNGALGSLQHLWHRFYHIELGHGYTPHQSPSWCMWSKGAESNN
jgi:hypothetical protein